MAEIFNFYVQDNRTIQFPKNNLLEPIMQEDHNVAVWRFRIPKVLNAIDMSGYAWWFVYVNAGGHEFSKLLTLVDDVDEPDSFCTADYSIDYGISYHPGNFQFSLEAINADSGGEVLNEWHTKTYAHKVDKTLQGNQVQWSETESDIISALIVEVQNKVAQLTGGATPEPKSLIADMTDTKKVYLYVGSETGESTNYWYYHNGSAWVAGGVYASGITVDAVPTQGSNNAVRSGGVYSALATKVDAVSGKGLSTNDYTDAEKQKVTNTANALSGKVAKPITSPNGTAGQLLRTNGDGTTTWVNEGQPTDAQTAQAVTAWLNAHPEATTTVNDGAVSEPKLAVALSKNLPRKDDIYRVINIASEKRALSVALVDKNNHAILFDLSDTDNANGVIDALDEVVNVDAVCISHYHYDHIGDYETIFATVPHSGCKFYIPEAPDSTYFASLNTVANDFISWIGTQTGCEIHYPEENETVKINDVNITFNNADPAYWYDNYDAGTLNYNWLSITAYVEFGGIAMQITGDLYTNAEKYFFEVLKAGRSADIYQAPHHGLSHYYVNRGGIAQVNPKIILTNYGTNNDYVSARKYSSAIVDLASVLGITVLDTADNGTFEITVTNGDISYRRLTPFFTTAILENYAYIRGLVLGGVPIEYGVSTHGIKDVLQMMPVNSAFTITAGGTYKILTDFGISNDAIIKIEKFVGGSTNYLWNRTDSSQFYFNIDIYTREAGRNHYNFHGRYRDSDGFTIYDSNTTKPAVLGFQAKKQTGNDAYLTLTKIGSLSRGTGIDISDNAIVVSRTGVYEMSLTAYSANISMDLNFANAPYYMRNGGTVTRVAQLIAGTSYLITSETNNTSSINGYIKPLAYSDAVAFPA